VGAREGPNGPREEGVTAVRRGIIRRTMRPPARLRPRLLCAALAIATLAGAPALAQQMPLQRAIPDGVELGRLRIGVFPEATIDGKPVLLGPGTRIRDESNTIRPPSTVDGERRIAYQRGSLGEVVQVWLVTDEEWRTISARIAAARRAAQQR
jgi:hypothetical protein